MCTEVSMVTTTDGTAGTSGPPSAWAVEAAALDVGYLGHAVVEQISLTLRPGGLLCLIGTNGSGKSTLLKTLAGLIEPVAGEVRVLGGAPGSQPARVGYLSQHPASSFTLPLRAADVVAMGRFAHLGLLRRTRPVDRSACAEAIERMGVGSFADAPLMELSGGQRQRVHLAQALARRADLLLLDEPTAGLDIEGRDTFARAVAAERARGCAVVMSTHDIDDAETADLVLLLAGRIVAAGPPEQVLTPENLRASFGGTGVH
jgi:ABC-type Mn2+/Zn2+ transport system ATPase subunit